jgi:2-methylcitrate dehydratase PrpD
MDELATQGRDAAEDITRAAHRIGFDDLPTHTVLQTKLLVLDTLGTAIAGIDADGCTALHDLVRGWGGAPQATVIGHGDRVPCHHAALVNACFARALELDEVHEQGLTHAAATMVPVALAVAEAEGGRSGREILTAIALGMDIGIRLALAPILDLGSAAPPRSVSRSYTTGTLAGSLVAAKLAGLDLTQTQDAFGIAYSSCAGNQQGLIEGTLSVRVQQGITAQLAIMAMQLARAGITGTRETLEGKNGYYEAFWRSRYDRSRILDDLGRVFRGDEASIKPYACCKYSHTAIAAALELAAEPEVSPEAIERIAIRVPSADLWNVVCEPIAKKTSPDHLAGPDGWALAQFSLPYVVAAALVRGQLTPDELSRESRTDRRILDLLAKIDLVRDDNAGPPVLPEPGHVELCLRSGRRLARTVTRALGHPERPMSVEDMKAKFRWCAKRLPPDRVESIIACVLDLENLADARALVSLTL